MKARAAKTKKTAEIVRDDQLRIFIKHSPAAQAMFDRQMCYLEASDRWIADLHLEGRDIRGVSHYDVFPEISEEWKAVHRRGLAGEVVRAEEDRFERADGSVQWLRWEVRPWRDSADTVGGIIIFFEEITGLKLAETALRESEARARVVSDFSPIGIFMSAPDGRILYDNVAIRRVLGTDSTKMIGDRWAESIHPDDKDWVYAAWTQFVSGENPDYDVEFRFVRPDRTTRLVHARATRIEEGERLLGFAGTAEDITDRREAEDELARHGRVLEASLNEIYLFKPESLLFEFVNSGARSNLGYSLGQLRAMTPVDIKPEFTEGSFRKMLEPLLRGERPKLVFDTIHRRADGSSYPVEVHLQLVEQSGKPVFLAVILDTTQRKRAEAALRASEERFRKLIENASDIVTVLNADAVIKYQGPSVQRILGYDPEELIGKSATDYVHPEDVATVQESIVGALSGSEVTRSIEYRFRHRDGSWRILQSVGRSLRDEAPDGYLVVNSRDITDSRKLEEQYRQAQKMEAIGQLAGGVAHDFNNMLAVVLVQCDLVMAEGGLSAEMRESIQEIKEAGQRAASLTRQLLVFSRKQQIHTRDLDLNDAVASITRMLQRIVGEDIKLKLSYAPQPLPVRADPGMMDQVLMNLAVNSRDALPRGGRLVIETAAVDIDEIEVAKLSGGRTGSFACLSISDNGSGIAAENLPRIFEPFFTTKDVGKGTGLGLATVFAIVQQHDGWINVYSEANSGSTFRVYLPLLPQSAAVPGNKPEVATMRKGTETVLVVEDDRSLRNLVRTVLTRLGYRVLEAETGRAALAVWHDHQKEIDLLLTDIVMPDGISGRELAEGLQSVAPELKIIYTSGYSVEIAVGGLDLTRGLNYLEKPFTAHQLARTVRAMLDS